MNQDIDTAEQTWAFHPVGTTPAEVEWARNIYVQHILLNTPVGLRVNQFNFYVYGPGGGVGTAARMQAAGVGAWQPINAAYLTLMTLDEVHDVYNALGGAIWNFIPLNQVQPLPGRDRPPPIRRQN
jgi:hypothetical protein